MKEETKYRSTEKPNTKYRKEDRRFCSVADEFYNKFNYVVQEEDFTKRVYLCRIFLTRSSLHQKDRFQKQGDWAYHFNRVSFCSTQPGKTLNLKIKIY